MRWRWCAALGIAFAAVACVDRAALRETTISPVSRAPFGFVSVERPAHPSPKPASLVLFDGTAWWSIDRAGAPVVALDVAPLRGSTHGAWVRDAEGIWRVTFDGARASWSKLPFPPAAGEPRALAALDHDRLAVATSRGVAIVSADDTRLVRAGDVDHAPDALSGGGGFAWVAWSGAVLRTDGVVWEELARGLAPGAGTSIEPEDEGAVAVVVDARGAGFRVAAEESIHLEGLSDGARITDTRVPLEAIPGAGTTLASVEYAVDGRVVATVASAPWGWGAGGAPSFDLDRAAFGTHEIRVNAVTSRGHTIARTLHVTYASPFASVPSYARDVVPIFRAACARCHERGPGRDLTTFDRFLAMAPRVRSAVRSSRMPPDFALDAESVAILTAWVDGGGPK